METLSEDPVSGRAIAVASFVLLAAPIAGRVQDQPMQHKGVMLMSRKPRHGAALPFGSGVETARSSTRIDPVLALRAD
jgi:hypothetical protein